MQLSKLYYGRQQRWLLYFIMVLISILIVLLISLNIIFSKDDLILGERFDRTYVVDSDVEIVDQIAYNNKNRELTNLNGQYFNKNDELAQNTINKLNSAFTDYLAKAQVIRESKAKYYNKNSAALNLLWFKSKEEQEYKKLEELKNEINTSSLDTLELLRVEEKLAAEIEQTKRAITIAREKAEFGFDDYSQENNIVAEIEHAALYSLALALSLDQEYDFSSILDQVYDQASLKSLLDAVGLVYREAFFDDSDLYIQNSNVKIIENGKLNPAVALVSNIDDKESRLQKLKLYKAKYAALIPFLNDVIKPNLVYDKEFSELQLKNSLKLIPIQKIKLKQGTILARSGDLITLESKALVGEYLKSNSFKRGIYKIAGISLAVFLSLLTLLIVISQESYANEFKRYKRKWGFIAVVAIFFSVLLSRLLIYGNGLLYSTAALDTQQALLFLMPVAFSGIVVAILVNPGVAAPVVIASAVLSSFIFPGNGIFLLFAIFSGLIAVTFVPRRLITRSSVMIICGKLAILNSVFIVAISFAIAPFIDNELNIVQLGLNVVYGVFGALSTGLVAMALLPIFEYIFDIKTDIKLLELSTVSHPLLQELMEKAPGSYYHSIAVGSLAEAGALKINANALFCRIASYYHDIGKISKANYFIENMQEGVNPHVTIDDPIYSKDIIIGHVSEGAALARKHELGQQLIDIIEEHHGTSLVRYFYDRAQKKKAAGEILDAFNESDFRYPGPKPQSPNSALIMLADICDASVRSLKQPTPEKITELVKTVTRHTLEIGQLDESRISLRDFKAIQQTYIDILIAQNHSRIEYPKIKKGQES